MADALQAMIGHRVVIDTDGPIVYLGKLEQITDDAFTLSEADLHDCRDGHANKEVYVAEASREGIQVNRRRIVVFRRHALSISRIEDVAAE